VRGEESKVVMRRQKAEVGQARTWGQCDDQWSAALSKRGAGDSCPRSWAGNGPIGLAAVAFQLGKEKEMKR
jgi:hypothetical protein